MFATSRFSTVAQLLTKLQGSLAAKLQRRRVNNKYKIIKHAASSPFSILAANAIIKEKFYVDFFDTQ